MTNNSKLFCLKKCTHQGTRASPLELNFVSISQSSIYDILNV